MLIDCNKLEMLPLRFYGGATGSKIAVVYDGTVFMLKSQQNLKLKKYNNVELSYANDPITEYIGSHIYELTGLPVHETLIGTYKGKVCVLCEDIAYPNSIIEFREIRNSIMDYSVTQHSSGMSTKLNDIFQIIDYSDVLPTEKCLQRFYDMFVVDALIGNTDRNNGNWGFLIHDGRLELAPIYDNGACLNNKRSVNQMSEDIATGNIENIALNYTFNFKNNSGKRINPFHYLGDNIDNEYIRKSFHLVTKITLDDIASILDSMGEILRPTQKEFYLRLLEIRHNELISIYKSTKSRIFPTLGKLC